MGQIILTQTGLEKFKAELHDVQTVKLPKAETEFKEVCEVWSEGDFPYYDTKTKRDFYLGRIKFLSGVIQSATWNESKGFFESSDMNTV